VATRWVVLLALLCTLPTIPSRAGAQPSPDALLTKLRTWTLADYEPLPAPATPPTHRMRLEMGIVTGTSWSPQVILDAARGAAAILAQCGIETSSVVLHEFEGPARYRQLRTPDAREFARRSGLSRPAIFFVDDTLQRPAFDAEAIGRGNARSRPEMADSVWITAAIRDLPIALAHELAHVLADSGEHSTASNNLMRADTAPQNTELATDQCARIVMTGKAHQLLEAIPEQNNARPPS
jgi:hypothetical protein